MNPTSLRALVLDEDLEVGIRAREVLAAAGISVSLACSLQDLEVALGAGLPPDLLVINVTGGVGAWQIAERIRRSPFDGRILAFVDRAADPGVTYLEQIPRTECRPRPPSSLINPMLRQMVHELART